MSARIVLFGMTVALAPGSLGHSSIASKVDPSELPLRLSVRADRPSYRMSDTMTLETRLTNISDHPVFLYEWDFCWNFARGLALHVIDAQGHGVRTQILPDCVPPPPREGNVYQFVKIGGRRFYGLETEFPVKELINEPGQYALDVSFDSSLSAGWVSEYLRNDPISRLPPWTMEKPTLKAARVHFTVVP